MRSSYALETFSRAVLTCLVMARVWMVAALLLLACDGTANQPLQPMLPPPPRPAPVPAPPPAPPADWNAEVSLDGLLPPGAEPVGVAVDRFGRRFVLDRRSGLYQLDGVKVRLIMSITE